MDRDCLLRLPTEKPPRLSSSFALWTWQLIGLHGMRRRNAMNNVICKRFYEMSRSVPPLNTEYTYEMVYLTANRNVEKSQFN